MEEPELQTGGVAVAEGAASRSENPLVKVFVAFTTWLSPPARGRLATIRSGDSGHHVQEWRRAMHEVVRASPAVLALVVATGQAVFAALKELEVDLDTTAAMESLIQDGEMHGVKV